MTTTAGSRDGPSEGPRERDATIEQQGSCPAEPVKTSSATKVYKNTNVTLRSKEKGEVVLQKAH